jgi:hypothetical protein
VEEAGGTVAHAEVGAFQAREMVSYIEEKEDPVVVV